MIPMTYLAGFVRILVISFISEMLHALLPLPVPAGIYGIIILFVLLETGLMKPEKVRPAGRFLIDIMPVMFIPAAVGIMAVWGDIAPHAAAYAAVLVISTVAVMGVTGRVTQALSRRQSKEKGREA